MNSIRFPSYQPDLMDAVAAIEQCLATRDSSLPVMAGISGIDASGKGYISRQLADHFLAGGTRVALFHVDEWLNLPEVRFSEDRPAETFYRDGLRLDEMFARLLTPLKQNGQVHLEFDAVDETATAARKCQVRAAEIDLVLVEGVFLFKSEYQQFFDLRIWVDCTRETALDRALRRGQEGLSPAATVQAYRTIWFPAQRIHFARDYPRAAADVIVFNDPRMFSESGEATT